MTAKNRKKTASIWRSYLAMLMAGIAVSASSCQLGERERESAANPANSRPVEHRWAERMDLPGLPNLHKVSDSLYRGAQPTAEGMKQLEKFGIKTIVNLRFLTSDRKMLKSTKLEYEHINTTTFTTETKNVVRFLKIATDTNRTPVFVHCHRGAERTGVMCAAYRIIVEGWSKEEAIEEMTQGGFTTHNIKENLLDYIRKMDIEKIQHGAGLRK